MTKRFFARLLPIVFFALLAPTAAAQAAAPSSSSKPAVVRPGVSPKVCERCIRAHEEFLASDAMQGRGSATHDELVAATYVASELRQYGVEPAGDNGSYIQHVPTVQRNFVSPPQLRITSPESTEPITWDYGKDFLAVFLTQAEFSGRLRKLDADKLGDKTNPKAEAGAV